MENKQEREWEKELDQLAIDMIQQLKTSDFPLSDFTLAYWEGIYKAFIRKVEDEARREAIRAIFSGSTVELDGKFYKISNSDAYRFITNHKDLT